VGAVNAARALVVPVVVIVVFVAKARVVVLVMLVDIAVAPPFYALAMLRPAVKRAQQHEGHQAKSKAHHGQRGDSEEMWAALSRRYV
jgi:hypothetical protein